MRASLIEIGLHSEDPERLGRFYGDALGYQIEERGTDLVGTANHRRLVIRRGPARTLAFAGYAMADDHQLSALKRRLAASDVPFGNVQSDAFEAGAIEFADPDGNRFRFGVGKPRNDPAGDATSMRAARLQHVVFATTDLEALLPFFTDVVGFTLSDRVIDDAGVLRTAFVRSSEDHHSLALFAANENRLDHHCYEAGDWNLIRDWGDHFAKHRIPLKWGPGRHGPGNNLFLFIHDPDGNWVEISAELEQVEEHRPVGEWPHEEYTLNTWGIGLLRS